MRRMWCEWEKGMELGASGAKNIFIVIVAYSWFNHVEWQMSLFATPDEGKKKKGTPKVPPITPSTGINFDGPDDIEVEGRLEDSMPEESKYIETFFASRKLGEVLEAFEVMRKGIEVYGKGYNGVERLNFSGRGNYWLPYVMEYTNEKGKTVIEKALINWQLLFNTTIKLEKDPYPRDKVKGWRKVGNGEFKEVNDIIVMPTFECHRNKICMLSTLQNFITEHKDDAEVQGLKEMGYKPAYDKYRQIAQRMSGKEPTKRKSTKRKKEAEPEVEAMEPEVEAMELEVEPEVEKVAEAEVKMPAKKKAKQEEVEDSSEGSEGSSDESEEDDDVDGDKEWAAMGRLMAFIMNLTRVQVRALLLTKKVTFKSNKKLNQMADEYIKAEPEEVKQEMTVATLYEGEFEDHVMEFTK